MEIKPFDPQEIMKIRPREPDKSIVENIDTMKLAREYATHGPCWTGHVGEEIMFCAGIIILWDGVGEGWAYTSNLVKEHPMAFHRAIKRGIEAAAYHYHLRRLQISIPYDHTVSCEWIQRLGFTEESKMQYYGPNGELYVRYVRFFGVS